MISIKNVTKKFPTVTALDNISLDIKEKEFFGLLGPNGAGKSTLMNLIIGYLDADEGELTVAGEKVTRNNLESRKKIGLVPQSIALYDDISAQENLEIFGSFFGIKKNLLRAVIAENLNRVELYDRRKDKVKGFSGGMKRRLNIAASLLHDPEILLCDEPTVGVDPQSRNAIFDYLEKLNEEGKTIIYTTHYMEEAERLCSRIAIIDHGKIIGAGSLDELLLLLPYEQTILISKNQLTEHKKDLFGKFGTILNDQEKYELKPFEKLKLSDFFKAMEENGIGYNFIDVNKPSLEALFLHLTGRRLRD
ncbi:MAG: ABC transporter ATP-binding protein [Bacteroidetes bacterium]|nr:ABC transporter ATP-binding protein [Bacteroidota bacterium]